MSVAWLDWDNEAYGRKKIVIKVRCSVCSKFRKGICLRRNFSERWLSGAELIHTSNIRDHAKADQHEHAMNLLKREHARQSGSDPTTYVPIARALNKLSDSDKCQLQDKLYTAYFTATEKISLIKYVRLCELEARHGVDIGSAHTNEIACKTFTYYLAE